MSYVLHDVLNLDLHKFAHSGTSRSQETHHKVPLQVVFEFVFLEI